MNVIEQAALGKVQPGNILPIRYNPNNPQDILINPAMSQEEFQHALEQNYLQRGIYTEETLRLTKEGIKTQGLILSSSPLEIVDGDIVAFEVEVKVTRPEGGVFTAKTIKKVSQQYASALIPGKIIEVYYLAHEEDNIALKISV